MSQQTCPFFWRKEHELKSPRNPATRIDGFIYVNDCDDDNAGAMFPLVTNSLNSYINASVDI